MWTPVLTPTLYQHPTSSPCIHIRRTGARIDSFSHSHSGRIRVFILSLADARYPSATMMFCTTFLSTPADELVCEGGVGEVKGGGRSSPVGVVPGQGLGPGGCLSTLHCLVLPQEELCQSLAYRQGDGPCGNSAVGKRMLLEVNRATSFSRDDRGGGGCGARKHRSRSVSPALGRRPASPAKDWFKGMVARGTWTLRTTFCMGTSGWYLWTSRTAVCWLCERVGPSPTPSCFTMDSEEKGEFGRIFFVQ